MADDSQTWGSRKWRLIKKQQARLNQANAATPHLDAARAELASGPKLVVESLEEKLARRVPGAHVIDTHVIGSVVRYEVRQAGKFATRTISDGATVREAVDRAVFLWGER